MAFWSAISGREGVAPPLRRAIWAIILATLSATSAHAGTSEVMVGVRSNMRAELFIPDGAGPFPAILLLHTSGGLRQPDLDYAQRLAQQGYVVLVPAFLEAYGISPRERQVSFTGDATPIYADFRAALDRLAHDPHVIAARLGAIGFSNGGYFAMWLAATGQVRAGVAYYGAFSGAGSDPGLSRFRSSFSKASAPVLILHGTADTAVHIRFAQRLTKIVAAAGSPCEFQFYDGAGHRFDRTGSPPDQAAAADAWQRTLAFFARYLKP